MKTTLETLYWKFRKHSPFMLVGHNARLALDATKTLLAFQQAESDGLARMRAEPESENYFDVFGEPELGERNGHPMTQEETNKELEAVLERYGVWWNCFEYHDGEEWVIADSCGMHTGYKNPLDPFENCYVIDGMQSALDALAKHQDDAASEETESHDAACRDLVTV